MIPLPLPLVIALAVAPAQDDGSGWRWKELDLDVWIESEDGFAHVAGSGALVLEAERSSGPLLMIHGDLFALDGLVAPGAVVELGRSDGDGTPVATARLRFAEPRTRGAEVRVEYEADSRGTNMQFAVTEKAAVASWTQAWYPLPSGTEVPWSRLLAAAGVTRFHLPDGWKSVSNGARVAEDGAEPGVETWRVAEACARSFACGPFVESRRAVGGREVAIHRLASAGAGAERELGAVAEILRVLEQRYGPYPYPSYRVAELPLGVGDFLGSSEQGFIMVRPVAFDAPDGNLALFGHELAHGWWGNRISGEGPGEMLLDEGLSQFSAVVAIEALEGEAAAADFLRFSRPGYVSEQCARGYFDLVRTGRDLPLATLGTGGDAHQLVDSKGHWVWNMLRSRMGDARFFAVLREAAAGDPATPLLLSDLRRRFERAAPDAGLARFFADWLDRAGAPVLESTWTAEPGGARVTVRQVQPGEPFRLDLEIALDSSAGRRVHAVELDGREQAFALASDAPVAGIDLDPRHRLLIWTSEYGPAPER